MGLFLFTVDVPLFGFFCDHYPVNIIDVMQHYVGKTGPGQIVLNLMTGFIHWTDFASGTEKAYCAARLEEIIHTRIDRWSEFRLDMRNHERTDE